MISVFACHHERKRGIPLFVRTAGKPAVATKRAQPDTLITTTAPDQSQTALSSLMQPFDGLSSRTK